MNTLISLFWESTRIVRFIMMLVSILGAIGLAMRSDSPGGDTTLLFHLHPWWLWAVALTVVAFERWWCLWMSPKCKLTCSNTNSALSACILALYVWLMMLISATRSDDFGLALMMTVCIACEFWILARVFAERHAK